MLYLVMLACLSAVSAQLVSPYYPGPYSIFNSFQSYNTCPTSVGTSRACLKTTPVNCPLRTFLRRQPQLTRVVRDTPAYREVDNICITQFPLPDDSDTFIEYDSIVYRDGSNKIVTGITTDIGIGTYSKSSTTSTLNQRAYYFDGETYIGCDSLAYGDADDVDDMYVLTLGNVALNAQSINNIQNILISQGQDPCNLYVLPYNRPTRCVTQQVCSLVNPFQF